VLELLIVLPKEATQERVLARSSFKPLPPTSPMSFSLSLRPRSATAAGVCAFSWATCPSEERREISLFYTPFMKFKNS
jgi:hypothetical protein